MAKPKPVVIDGEYFNVSPVAKIIDVVPDEVSSVVTHDGALIPRSEFARVPVPQGFQTNLSAINKGTRASSGTAIAERDCAAVVLPQFRFDIR